MNRKKFVAQYTHFVQIAMKLAQKAKRNGIEALEDETEDIEEAEKVFKEGLRLIVDKTDPALVDEILTNTITHEKNKYIRLYKTIQKRSVLGIQSGESYHILYKVLCSLAGLTPKEEQQIGMLLLADNGDQPETAILEQTNDIIEDDPELAEAIKNHTFIFEYIARLNDRAIQKILRETDSVDLAKALKAASEEARGRIFKNISKRATVMLKEDMDYMGPVRRSDAEEAQQKIISTIMQLAAVGEIIVG
jgi:Mg/Co/Ni transporter MgtE